MEFITSLIKKNWQNQWVQKAVENVREGECESSLKKYFIVQNLKIFEEKYFIVQKLKIVEELTKFSSGIRRNKSMFWGCLKKYPKCSEDFQNILASIVRKVKLLYYRSQ